jgi:hypothetical protein
VVVGLSLAITTERRFLGIALVFGLAFSVAVLWPAWSFVAQSGAAVVGMTVALWAWSAPHPAPLARGTTAATGDVGSQARPGAAGSPEK